MPVRVSAALPAAILAALAATGCGGGHHAKRSPPPAARLGLGPVQIVAARTLRAGANAQNPLVRQLPPHFAVSVDLAATPGAELRLAVGTAGSLVLQRGRDGTWWLLMRRRAVGSPAGASRADGPRADGPRADGPRAGGSRTRRVALRPRPGWPAAGPRHLELAGGRLSLDGASIAMPRPAAGDSALTLTAARGSVDVSGLIISDSADRGSLLLHRLAELHARVPAGGRLIGADHHDQLHYGSYWTSGFLAGALWQAAGLEPAGGLFARWALQATRSLLGAERTPTDGVGVVYGQSSLAAWTYLCRSASRPNALCGRLRRSVLAAAGQLRMLAAGNPGAGTIPTDTSGAEAETIIDSMMSIAVLPWAGASAGERSFTRLALHQARVIGSLLVRPDGSSFGAVRFGRASGRIGSIRSRHAISDHSTWARGEAWALYGFAQAAQELRDTKLLSVAQRLAGYVARHTPPDGLPPWDYGAPTGKPVDVSTGVIDAAGLLHLVSACGSLRGSCGDTSAWLALARSLITAGLKHASPRPPLGLLAGEVLDGRVRTCCNGQELTFGLDYALEALALERRLAG